jgi:carbamoyl-phosphate synthase/aspartate carbamoyltransferase
LSRIHAPSLQYLEALGDETGDKQKSEYSLTQHLANNMIDMYINLPSKNHYRRPATYASKGYRTRRLAVDFAVPLITNVKVAKLFIEALVRKLPLEVSSTDYKTSHTTHTFPGFVNIAAFVPGLTLKDNTDFVESTKASLGSGFTTTVVLPKGLENQIEDRRSLDCALLNAAGGSHCNYALGLTSTSINTNIPDKELQDDTKFFFIPFRQDPPTLSVVAAYFGSKTADKLITTDAKGPDLASCLLLASLHNRPLHVMDLQGEDDITIVSLSKAKGLKVTCDVSVYSLFFDRDQFPGSTRLPSAKDRQALWKNIGVIDAFSIGQVPYFLAEEQGEPASAWSGVEEALPLLLTAVSEGRLTLEDIQKRLHDNPVRIFALPDKVNTHVEVVIGRKTSFKSAHTGWSPLNGQTVNGAVHRVLIKDQTAFVDGAIIVPPSGRDVSSATAPHHVIEQPPSRVGLVKPESTGPQVATRKLLETALPLQSSGMNLHLTGHWKQLAGFHRKHVLTVKQFTKEDIHELFSLAHEMQLQVEKNGSLDLLKGKILATLFYEPSTRTSSSFDAAMKRCGGQVIQVVADTSSVKKGESLPDTIRTLGSYADAIVIRHPDVGSSQLAAKFSPVPILNAGDGIGEHPTQVGFVLSHLSQLAKTPLRRCLTFTPSGQNSER